MQWKRYHRVGRLACLMGLSLFGAGCTSLQTSSPSFVELNPLRPAWSETVSVRVKTTRNDGVLHWGVNQGAGDWKLPAKAFWPEHASLGDSGKAIDIPLPPPKGGVSEVELGPFDFGGQVVTSLHFAVRFGEDEWVSNGGTNFNFSIGGEPLPWQGAQLQGEEGLRIPLPDRRFDGVPVYVHGRPISLEAKEGVVIPLEHIQDGDNRISMSASEAGQIHFAESNYFHQPDLEEKTLAASEPYGAFENEPGTVRFHFKAPEARFVKLKGLPQGELLMHPSGDGRWSVVLNLAPGRYTYQYEVDGKWRAADPYAREIEWKDPLGRESGIAEHARAVIRVGEHPPLKPHGLEEPIPLEKLIIYEAFTHDLAPLSGFRGLSKKLDEIRSLGVNALELLPVYAAPRGDQWGYNAGYHFAPEESLGSESELKALIGEAHTRGFAVLLDMVFNHMDAQSGLAYLHGSDWEKNPYFRKFDGFNWGMPDADQASPHFKAYVQDVIAYWLKEYRVDGFRYDATQWVGWKGYNEWGAGWFAWCGKQVDSNSIHIAENLPCEIPMITETEMDSEWDGHFRWRIREIFKNQEIREPAKLRDVLMPLRQGYDSGFQRMVYTESHDEERYLTELLHEGFSEEEAIRRCLSAWTIACTVPGVPMMFSGQEYGETAERVVGPNPLDWRKRYSKPGRKMVEAFSEITKLRAEHPALSSEEMRIQYLKKEEGTLVYERGSESNAAVVAVNVSAEPREVFIRIPHGGFWQELGQSKGREVKGGTVFPASLEPGQVLVLYSAL